LKSPLVKPLLSNLKREDIPISREDLLPLMQDVLTRGASFQFRARGASMSPFIKDGDVVTVAPLNKQKPAMGKVVAFLQPVSGHLSIHRIVGRQGLAFLMQGDNAAGAADGLVFEQDILGCVTRVERNGRRIILGLGPERYLVAWLSRNGLLIRVLNRYWWFKSFYRKKLD